MRYSLVNSKFGTYLRLQTVFLTVIWLWIRNWSEFEDQIEISLNAPRIDGKLMWKEIDPQSPPSLPSDELESLRLNELLAHTQYHCKNIQNYPKDGRFAYGLCKDPQIITNPPTYLVSMLGPLDRLEFEQEIVDELGSKLKLLLLSSSEIVAGRWKKVEQKWKKEGKNISATFLNMSMFQHERGAKKEEHWRYLQRYFDVNSIKNAIVKLDYNGRGGSSAFRKLVGDLLAVGLFKSVQELHITIHIQKMDGNLIYDWYLVLIHLFYDGNMALYRAMQLGACGRDVINCQYKLSFVTAPQDGSARITAPIMGLASPDEEFHRIHNYLESMYKIYGEETTPSEDLFKASVYAFDKQWKITEKIDEVLLFRNQDPEISIADETLYSTNFDIKLHAFIPSINIKPNTKNSTKNAYVHKKGFTYFYDFGLSEDSQEHEIPVRNQFGIVKSMEKILRMIDIHEDNNSKLALILDLEGGEWQVLDHLLTSKVLKKFSQISISFNLWFGEEFENYQAQYSWLLRLENIFKVVHQLKNTDSTQEKYNYLVTYS